MAWLAVDCTKVEIISRMKPLRWDERIYYVPSDYITMPEGSIKRLIGRELTWEDDPVEFVEVVE
jgi:hypothetical protein